MTRPDPAIIDGVRPRDAAVALDRRGIFAWDGDFYAQALIERLGLAEAVAGRRTIGTGAG